jgi:hypothetical protein
MSEVVSGQESRKVKILDSLDRLGEMGSVRPRDCFLGSVHVDLNDAVFHAVVGIIKVSSL